MKQVIKRSALILTFVMICCISYGSLSVSAADFKDMGTKSISDVNKVWTVEFGKPVDISSLNNNIKVQDLTDGSTISVSVSAGADEDSAKINPPSGGYKLSHNYKLTIDKSTKSKNGESLTQSAVLNFSLTSNSSNSSGSGNSSSGNNSGTNINTKYTASANVVVSKLTSTMKEITISTNLPNVTKYKIEQNNNSFTINSTAPSFASKDTLQVYLYDSNDKLLGTSTLDASSTKDNISMNVTLAN